MINSGFVFPDAPVQPLSVWSLLGAALKTYSKSFGFCMRLMWFPCLLLIVGGLPFSFETGGSHPYIIIAGKTVWFAIFGLLSLWNGILRSTALKRMVLTQGLEFVPAIAFANRLGWKNVVARMAMGSFQLFWLGAPLIAGLALFDRDPHFSVLFVIAVGVLSLFSLIAWISGEFFYESFSVVLATENAGWKAVLKRAFDLFKSVPWKGFGFSFLIQMAFLGLALLSPATVWSIGQVGLCCAGLDGAATPPLWLELIDDVVEFGVNLVTIPLAAICYSYFVNDVRLRLQEKQAQSAQH